MAKKIAIDIDIQGTKDVLDLQKAIRNTKKELKETNDVKAYDNLAADLVKLNAQLKEARKRQRQAVDAFTATDKGIGAYSRLSAQLRVARNNLKDLAAAGQTTGKEVDDLTKEINELDTTLKDIDRSVGQTNREVGNYEEAIRKATGLTEKQTGAFTRMNGKLNVLKKSYKDVVIAQGSTSKGAKELRKEIDKLERTLKQAGDTGQKTGKRIGGVRTQLRGLGGPLAGLASGFLIFSELPQALSSINDGLKTFAGFISVAEAQNQAFTKGIQEGAQALQEEQGDLALRLSAITESTEGTEEHNDAINAALKEYGPYLSDLAKEELLLGNVALAQREVTEQLIENTAQQAAAAFQQETLNSLTTDFADRVTIAAERQTSLGQTIDNTSKAAAGPLGLLVELFTGVEASVGGVRESLNEVEIATKKGLLGQGDAIKDDFVEGFTEISGFLETQNASLIESARIRQEEAAADRLAREEKAAQKRAAAARKRAEEEAARILARNAANQEKFLEQEIQNAKRREQVLLKLSEQLDTAILQNLEEGEEKQIKLEQDASQRRIKNLKAQQKAFEAQQTEQVQKAISIFGFQSQEVIDLEKQTGEELERIRGSVNALITQETEASLTRQEEIREDFAAQEIANQEKINEEKEKLRQEDLKKQKEAADKEREINQRTTEFALNSLSQSLDFADQFSQAISDRNIQRLERLKEERAANIEGLQNELQSASGLEKQFLEQRVREEQKAAADIAANQERINKKQAIANKAIAIGQAIINGALAVTNIWATMIDPTPVQAFKIAGTVAALATTAAEIATIAATPVGKFGGIVNETFARGGMVNGPSHARGGVKFAVGGQVKELEGGEAVINKRSTALFKPQLSAMNVVGGGVPFARGGVISPPMGAPSLSPLTAQNNDSIALIQSNQATIKELQNSLMRMEVVYTTNTEDAIQADKQDRKEIQTRASI